MYHNIVQRTQLFPEEHWIPESFFSYSDASGEASTPPRSRSLVAGSLVLTVARCLGKMPVPRVEISC